MKILSKSVIAVLVMCIALPMAPARAMIDDIYQSMDSASADECPGKSRVGAKVYLQTRVGTGMWTNRNPSTVGRTGCFSTAFYPADLVPATVGQVSVRFNLPRQRVKGRAVSAWHSREVGYRVWPTPTSSRDPIPHLDGFSKKYDTSVATITCRNTILGTGGQGTGFRIPMGTDGDAIEQQYGTTYLVTAGHVTADCMYRDVRNVTVTYKGVDYRGYVWTSKSDPDISLVVTNAPMETATLGRGARPQIGDAAASIGTAGGILSTTTQGQISGVSDTELNTTVPSGHGASGGPLFDNQGRVIGIIVAGNGSLTVATALPAFCGNVYNQSWCSSAVWN